MSRSFAFLLGIGVIGLCASTVAPVRAADQEAAGPASEQKVQETRGWLGIHIQSITPEIAEKLRLPEARGALVSQVEAGSPAERVGIKSGDVIVEFGGVAVGDSETLIRMVRSSPRGKEVPIRIIRDQQAIVLAPSVEGKRMTELDLGLEAYWRKDYGTALKYLESLANAGNARAQGLIGLMYLHGQGVPQDDREAVKWFRKGVEQDNADAQSSLGWMYQYGRGVPKDEREAVRLYQKSADRGDQWGQYFLGWMYQHGQGVTKNEIEAVRWYRKAAAQGHSEAKKSLETLKHVVRRLEAEEQAQGLAKVAEQTEQAGNLREALKEYVTALQSTPQGTVTEQQLRERIINLVQKLDPPPAVSEEAERHMIRAATAAKIAKTDKDIQEAIAELEKALRISPWLADGYYNLAIFKERVNDYAGAIANLKLYLLTPRAAADALEVRKKIIALEYLQERSGKKPGSGGMAAVSGGAVSVSPVATIGDMWVYKSYNTVNGWGTTQYRVIGTGDNEIRLEQVAVYKDVTTNSVVSLTKEWNIVSISGTTDTILSPFEALHLFPLEVGKRWQQSYEGVSGGIRLNNELTAEVKNWEKVSVPAGTFDALRIDSTTQTTGSVSATTTRTIWFSPQVKRAVRDEFFFTSGSYRWKYLYELERYNVQ